MTKYYRVKEGPLKDCVVHDVNGDGSYPWTIVGTDIQFSLFDIKDFFPHSGEKESKWGTKYGIELCCEPIPTPFFRVGDLLEFKHILKPECFIVKYFKHNSCRFMIYDESLIEWHSSGEIGDKGIYPYNNSIGCISSDNLIDFGEGIKLSKESALSLIRKGLNAS